jgi:periplasmic divalent cation tolerance protein
VRYEFLLVMTTCAGEEEANKIAAALISEHAAACCNVAAGLRSVYFWQDKLQNDREVLLLIKTTADSFPRVQEIIAQLHSYQVPEIITLPIIGGSESYLKWVSEQTTITPDLH